MLSNKRGSQPAERPLASDVDLVQKRLAYYALKNRFADLEFPNMVLHTSKEGVTYARILKVPLKNITLRKLHLHKHFWLRRRRMKGERAQSNLYPRDEITMSQTLELELERAPPVRVRGQ